MTNTQPTCLCDKGSCKPECAKNHTHKTYSCDVCEPKQNKGWRERFKTAPIIHHSINDGSPISGIIFVDRNDVFQFIENEIEIAEQQAYKRASDLVLEMTRIPRGARNPTRDIAVILGEKIAQAIEQLAGNSSKSE